MTEDKTKQGHFVQTMSVQKFRERLASQGRRNLDWMEQHDTNNTWVCRGRKGYPMEIITKGMCSGIRERGECDGCEKQDYGERRNADGSPFIHNP